MSNFFKAAGVACVAMVISGLAAQAQIRIPNGQYSLERKRQLGCYIDYNHLLHVGSSYAVRAGTRIWFVAKLENAGLYYQTPILPIDIPAHLFVVILNQPVFDRKGDCQAWWIQQPLIAPFR